MTNLASSAEPTNESVNSREHLDAKEIVAPSFDILLTISMDESFPRGYYAASVLLGKQSLSGADLKGKAREYGSWYSLQRAKVEKVAAKYNVIPVHNRQAHNKLVWHHLFLA